MGNISKVSTYSGFSFLAVKKIRQESKTCQPSQS